MEIRGAKNYLTALAAIVLLFTAIFAPGIAFAEPSGNDIEGIKKQIDELDAELQKVAREYNTANYKLTTTTELVDQNKKRLADLDTQVVQCQARVNQRVNDIYRHGAISLVEVILNSGDFMRMINRIDLLTIIGEKDAQDYKNLMKAKAEQERITGVLADAKQKQEQLARKLRYNRSVIYSKLRKEKKIMATLSIAEEMGMYRKPMRVAVARDNNDQANVRIGNFVFPVLGPHTYSNDWGAPRVGHRHQGTDIFALSDTPLVACTGGTIITTWTGGGGKTVYLDGDDGNLYVYMHCSNYEKTAGRVEAGETIAYCGMTGNATGYHLHFEIHANGDRPINPYPILQATGY